MAYEPTHEAPPGGLPAFTAPDPGPGPAARLDAGLDLELLERRDDWARIKCSNGWEAWVDARRLVERSRPAPPPASQILPSAPSPAFGTPAAPTPQPAPAPAATPPPTPAPAPSSSPTETIAGRSTPTPTPGAPAAAPSWSAPAAPPPPPGGAPPPPGGPAAPGAWSPGGAPPPPGAPGAPAPGGWVAPSPGARAGRSSTTTIGPGSIVAFVGAALLVIGGILNWVDFDGSTASAHNIPLMFVFDWENAPDGGLGIGWTLILLAALCVVGGIVPQVKFLPIVGGGLALVVIVLYLIQANSFVGEFEDFTDIGLGNFFKFGVWVALLGAIAAIVGGVLRLAER